MKIVLAVLAVAIGLNVVLAYLWIDRSITLTYIQASEQSSSQMVRSFERLLEQEWKGLSEAQLLEKLHRVVERDPDGAKSVIKEDGDVISFDDVCFKLNHGHVGRVGDCYSN
ncbi:Imm58 family immunity protein [Ralstonia solanacearum]|uniref:Imm58 family immunity protein n=1 Tax=Ralstonia solanacearum TaxID=305 RepID=UPI0012FD5191|nr:Imm58 family immunity protein [Ralstonia solanacearum]